MKLSSLTLSIDPLTDHALIYALGRITLRELGKRSGVDFSHINRWLNGHGSMEMSKVEQLLKAAQIQSDFFNDISALLAAKLKRSSNAHSLEMPKSLQSSPRTLQKSS